MFSKISNFLLEQFGIDIPRLSSGLLALPGYLKDLYKFRKLEKNKKIILRPCLHDRNTEAGSTKGEYFWQDLYVARKIYHAEPERHVDIGSRFDGFVTHVASFREIEVIDIRPIPTKIPGVVFSQINMMSEDLPKLGNCFDSASCLHAIEHFGLGRYGDPIDPDGHIKGLKNLAKLLRPSGRLYISTPVGHERVEFNANRVFAPDKFVDLVVSLGFQLVNLAYIEREVDAVVESTNIYNDIEKLKMKEYALGIFTFTKKS